MRKLREEMSVFEKDEARQKAREDMRKIRDVNKNKKKETLSSSLWSPGLKYGETELYTRDLEMQRKRMKRKRARFTAQETENENNEAKERMRLKRANQTEEERIAYNKRIKERMRELRFQRKKMQNLDEEENEISEDISDEEDTETSDEIPDEEENEPSDIVKKLNEEHRVLTKKEKDNEKVESEIGLNECICDFDIDCPYCAAEHESEKNLYSDYILTKEESDRFERAELEQYKALKKSERKERRKRLVEKAKKPIPPLPKRELSEYEKIREEIISQRNKEWAIYEKEWEKKWEENKSILL